MYAKITQTIKQEKWYEINSADICNIYTRNNITTNRKAYVIIYDSCERGIRTTYIFTRHTVNACWEDGRSEKCCVERAVNGLTNQRTDYSEGRPTTIPPLMRLKQRDQESRLKHDVICGITRRKDSEMACGGKGDWSHDGNITTIVTVVMLYHILLWYIRVRYNFYS